MSTPTTEKSAPTPPHRGLRQLPAAALGSQPDDSAAGDSAGGASAIIELDEAGQGGESPDAAGAAEAAIGGRQAAAAAQKHTSLHHTVAGGSSMDSGFLRQLENSIKTQRGPEIPPPHQRRCRPACPAGGLRRRPSSSAKSAAVIAELERSAEPAAPADAGVAAATAPKLEISLPETRKESPVKALRLPTQAAGGKESKKSSAKSPSGKRQAYHLVLTGPDLLFYRSRSTSGRNWPWPWPPSRWTRLAARQRLRRFHRTILRRDPLRLRYVAGGGRRVGGDSAGYDSSSLGRQADLYPSADCDMCCSTGMNQGPASSGAWRWSTPRTWQLSACTSLARSSSRLRSSRPHRTLAGASSSSSSSRRLRRSRKPRESKQRVSIAQRLNDFFRRRPALDELEKKGIVRNEPVFGSTLRQICAHERSDAPRFLSRCIEAIEATAWRLRASTGWAATRPPAKPSAKRESIRQVLRTLPPAHYNTLRLLFHHLTRVVQCSERNQMSSQNVALMMARIWSGRPVAMRMAASA
uniref:Rho-GAP domain-containing protein n=1 Tax=Macrostomum lignano TaxID=282301 RepID=A0A1I8FHI3_9PLAT